MRGVAGTSSVKWLLYFIEGTEELVPRAAGTDSVRYGGEWRGTSLVVHGRPAVAPPNGRGQEGYVLVRDHNVSRQGEVSPSSQLQSTFRSVTGRLRPDKHAAIMVGGREVFSRSGFERGSIDAIAAASSVSTRTIYKHFADKAALCAAVIADSAGRMAEDEVALIEQHLGDVSTVQEVEPALKQLATAWLSSTAPSADHRILMRQVQVEAAHLDPSVVTTWWEAGPGRVLEVLAKVFGKWGAMGLLRVPKPQIATIHYAELISAVPGPPTISTVRIEERADWVEAGVEAFVRAYRPCREPGTEGLM